jgi:hypothetical protein
MDAARAWAASTFRPDVLDYECPVTVTYLDNGDHVLVFSEDLDGYRFCTRVDSDGAHDLGESYEDDGSDAPIDTEE